jgi:DNA-binding protein HU-beta
MAVIGINSAILFPHPAKRADAQTGPTTPAKAIQMNKADLIDSVAEAADLSKAQAGRAVDALVDAISGALKNGDQVSIIGFGSFLVRHREARKGRNPKTGEQIDIAASNAPAFKAGKALKDAVN